MEQGSWWVIAAALVALATLGAGVGPDEQRDSEPSVSTSELPSVFDAALPPTSFSIHVVSPVRAALEVQLKREAVDEARRAKANFFMKHAKRVAGGVVGAPFSLMAVQYTSPTDAGAQFYDCARVQRRGCTTIVTTTRDNWSRAAGVAIPDGLADYVWSTPLGEGAVAIKAEREFAAAASYPPFVLYPSGRLAPLDVTHVARAPGADSSLLRAWDLPFAQGSGSGVWAADVGAAEVYPVRGAPEGELWKDVPGRGDAVLSVIGTRKTLGQETWRFATSHDHALSWRVSNIEVPAGKPPWGYFDHGEFHAVGPGHLQAVAWTDSPSELDLPDYVRDLWRTDDERVLHRVDLPWDRRPAGGMPFGGMAFARDGALLLAEAAGSPSSLCPNGTCHPGTIWRLPVGKDQMSPLVHAPPPFDGFRNHYLMSDGGVIVIQTGPRAIAVSRDGLTWRRVMPGR